MIRLCDDRKTIESLRRAYQTFKRAPFPQSDKNDELADLHADLVEYDAWVAGSISNLLSGYEIPSDHLEFDARLRSRAQALIANDNSSIVKLGQVYLDYLIRLQKLLDLAKASTELSTGRAGES